MRTCTNCNKSMVEGYLLEEMGDTFCSNFCLDIAYPGSSIEMANMTDEQLEESTWYWTSWEEDDTDEDEDDVLVSISLEDAVSAFEDEQRVYVVTQIYYSQAKHLDDINFSSYDAKYLVNENFAKSHNLQVYK